MVQTKEDLTGQVFGRLTVINQAEDYVNPNTGVHTARWNCCCSCGSQKLITVFGTSLKSGNTKSCGCLQKEKASKINSKDLTGQKFGKLTVIEKSENHITISGHHQSM